MLPTLDSTTAIWLNKLASHAPVAFNQLQRMVSDNNLVKCGAFMVATWWLWFRHEKDPAQALRNRQIIVGVLMGCLVAMLITRILTHALPYRARPVYTTELHLRPLFAKPPIVDRTTSFPSDHAALFCALATGFFFLSRRLGVAATLYALVFICFPRVYLGYHYLSDLVAGAIIGAAVACLANLPAVRRYAYLPTVHWQQRHPGLFYAVFFLLTYQIDDLFNSVRQLLAFTFGIGT